MPPAGLPGRAIQHFLQFRMAVCADGVHPRLAGPGGRRGEFLGEVAAWVENLAHNRISINYNNYISGGINKACGDLSGQPFKPGRR